MVWLVVLVVVVLAVGLLAWRSRGRPHRHVDQTRVQRTRDDSQV
jgi:hypothetical protein